MATYKYCVGQIHKNNRNEEYVITERISTDIVRIKFLDEYGYEQEVQTSCISCKSVVNPYYVKAYGKGYEGITKDLNVTRRERLIWFKLLKSKYEYSEKWNCLEYFIRDVRETLYYEDFLENDDLSIHFICEGNVVVGFKVDYDSRYGKRVKIRNTYDGSIEEFNSTVEAGEELGWCRDAIRKYCNENRVIDGYEYSWLKYGEE